MSRTKIAITLDPSVLAKLDQLVETRMYGSRSAAIEKAVEEKLVRLARNRLELECQKLDPAAERAMAEEGMAEDSRAWPEY